MDIIALSIPIFFLLIGVELAYMVFSKRSLYRLNDSLNDLSCGVLNQLVSVFTAALIFGIYVVVYDRVHLVDIPGDAWWAWALCIVGVDFGYYWFHRVSHEVNLLWLTHVPHHQSEEYNLSVALRQGAIEPWVTWAFYLPLAVIGFPPLMFLTCNALNTLYQFWVHTRAIDRLPAPVEFVFNTPSHHRVHHGCDPKYLDKNYSGFLILWDRLFGTYQEEEEEPTYGTTTQLASWNPVWAMVQFPVQVWRHARTLPTLGARIGIWFRGPSALASIGEVAGRDKYDAKATGTGRTAYALLQFVLGLAAAVTLLFLPELSMVQKVAGALFSTACLVGVGAVMEDKPWMRWLEGAKWLALPAVAFVLTGCAPTEVEPERAAELVLEDCREPGVYGALRCGTWPVAENLDAPEGRTIDLKVVVWPAEDAPVAEDPVFFLAGGPGQGATEVMGVAGFLREANEHRDVVFVDMRGTGGSNKLSCEVPDDASVAERLALDAGLEEMDECLAALDADTRFYTTPRLVADLDAVRAAMGYEQINLYGGSYGTRLGLAYVAAHEDRVRSAVFDGLAPFSMKLFLTFGEDGKRALDRLFVDCAADADCAGAFPDLEARFWTWLNGLPSDAALGAPGDLPPEQQHGVDPGATGVVEPRPTVRIRDPRTGQLDLEVPLDRASVAAAIRGLLYSVDMASLLPLALHRAIEGDVEPLLSQALIMGDGSGESMATGLMASVVCAEEIPRFTDAELAALADEPFLGRALVDMLVLSCTRWPAGEVPETLFEPVASDVPILLLSGAEDPVTPDRWAVEAAKTLTNARSATVPATGHIAAGAGCMDERVADFYADPAAELDLDAACITEVERPPFFVDFAGPTP